MSCLAPKRPRGIDSRIRTILQVKDYTVEKAAECCRLPKPLFEDYLSGKSTPGVAGIYCIATGIGCDMEWLKSGVRS